MHILRARNVCHAYSQGLELLRDHGTQEESRNGRVVVMSTPVVTVTERPTERVIFDYNRDANPFFHLFESLWMLAGHNDARELDRFVSDFSSRFAEDYGVMHGAYGFRWRHHFEIDQLQMAVDLLRADPTSRQVVIQMWDATADLGVPGLRDRPCNTQIYLRVRDDNTVIPGEYTRMLDLTVTCRSNDAIWGAHGANAVHFSVLQEWLAASIGVEVGRMYQFSNNYHVYEWALDKKVPGWTDGNSPSPFDPYTMTTAVGVRLSPSPMVLVPDLFLQDCERFVADSASETAIYANPWFAQTARPMILAHDLFRQGDKEAALAMANTVEAQDWSWAARRWISRRTENYNAA